jgi:signal transduction histidine kinase/HAMP domain-containing protein
MHSSRARLSRSVSSFVRRIPFRGDLGLQLLALYLLFVLPVAGAALVFDRIASQRLQQDVQAADLGLARAIALETDATLSAALHSVQGLADNPAVLEMDIPGMQTVFSQLARTRPDVNLIYRLGPDGLMIYHYPEGPGSTVGVDFSYRDYFQDARRLERPIVSKGRISPTTHEAVATAVMPVRNADGAFLGVVATNITLRSLSETLSAIVSEHRPLEGFNVSIVDGTGQIIADPNSSRLLAQLNDEVPEIASSVIAGQAGTLVMPASDGTERLYSYVPIPSAGWGVIVDRPTAVAFASAGSLHRGLLAAMAIFLIGGLLFWLSLTRRVLRPLERLASFSQAIGHSPDGTQAPTTDLDALSRRPDQVGHLTRSLARMEKAIEQRLTELSTLLDTSRTVVSSLNPAVVLDRILEQSSRLLEARVCAIVALDPVAHKFRVQASRGLSRAYVRRLEIDPSEPDSPSMRAIRSHEPVQISDTETDPTFVTSRPRARAEGYRSLLAVPLLTQHAAQAALILYRTEPHTFTEREVRLVWNFANHAAMAIENAALYARSDERLQEQTRRLEALVQSLDDGLILEDPAGKVLYCNRRVCELAAVSPTEAHEWTASQLRSRLLSAAQDPEQAGTNLEAALTGGGSQSVDINLSKSGVPVTLRFQTFNVTDTRGELIGRGEIILDVTGDRELDRMKDSLIATVSHELRTPLAAIKGYATTLLADDVQWDDSAQREFIRVISDETDRLSLLVNDLLDLSRIEGGELSVERSTCAVETLVERAAQRARPSPSGRLKVTLPPDLPMIRVDPRRIESVIRNLLENAVKYSGSDADIELSAEQVDGQVIVRVEDQGPGIPAEFDDRVFDPFFRLDNGLARRASGAGLGLSICRGFVRAHGGEIWIESRPRGTCVAFSLPVESGIESD